MREANWYFDFISPYSYLALHRLKAWPHECAVRCRPVLFAGLLNHFGQKGPAEIPGKRRWTYRWCNWYAAQLGVPFRFPASHPFNSLHHLRLAIAAGATHAAVEQIFADIWTSAAEASDPRRFATLHRKLAISEEQLLAPEVKDALRRNTEEAAARGVFGVPTLEIDGELFWGADAMDFASAYLTDPQVLRNDEMRRVDALPVGAARKAS
jgi:2-hydroxychromene-2-carboxylate isomerase